MTSTVHVHLYVYGDWSELVTHLFYFQVQFLAIQSGVVGRICQTVHVRLQSLVEMIFTFSLSGDYSTSVNW